ncbi:MAG: prepilin-type N-terminal cleavage/methylation domain-containing protein [Nitrospiria bacterium]
MTRPTCQRGFSLIELLIAIGILSVLMAAVFTTFSTQMRLNTREYRIGESEIELGIVKKLIERDVVLAGYGLADNYAGTGFNPQSVSSTGTTLTLRGTAPALTDRAPVAWTYALTGTPTFRTWLDSREDLQANANAVLLEPNTGQILTQNGAGNWKFKFVDAGNTPRLVSDNSAWTNPVLGTVVYGVHPGATEPFAAITYQRDLATASPSSCNAGTRNLIRTEAWTGVASTSIPLLSCVLAFQTALGLDGNEDGLIDVWDSTGATAGGYTAAQLKKRVKQVRVYVLIQNGNRDAAYTYPAATVRVGDAGLGIGADIALSAEQRRFPWRLVSIDVTPRNMR